MVERSPNTRSTDDTFKDYLALRCIVWVNQGDQSPSPPGIYRFRANPEELR